MKGVDFCRTFVPSQVLIGLMVQPFPTPSSLIPLKLPFNIAFFILVLCLFPFRSALYRTLNLPPPCPLAAPHLQRAPDTLALRFYGASIYLPDKVQ